MRRTSKNTIPAKFSELPKSYAALCAILMPRTIHDEIERENVTEILDLMAGHKLTNDQADYLDTLATLAADFEDQNVEPLPKLPPHQFLAAHLENIGMSASAWGELIGIDRSTASRLLRGERGFNASHIRNTAKALAIAPDLLL
jgi:antitoxin component HigA of HigAB toxin-antitoxin module